ncbi:hypothetical protein V8C86DRAFT_51588 [Haematococcus lacustris]
MLSIKHMTSSALKQELPLLSKDRMVSIEQSLGPACPTPPPSSPLLPEGLAALAAQLAARCDASEAAVAKLQDQLTALQQQQQWQAQQDKQQQGAKPAAQPAPVQLQGADALPGLASDVKVLQEQLRVQQQQTASVSLAHTSLVADVRALRKKLDNDNEVLTTQLKLSVKQLQEQLDQKGTSSLPAAPAAPAPTHDLQRKVVEVTQLTEIHSLQLRGLQSDLSARLALVEEGMDRLVQSGLLPPPETATKQELAIMEQELQAKVSELAKQLEETLKPRPCQQPTPWCPPSPLPAPHPPPQQWRAVHQRQR